MPNGRFAYAHLLNTHLTPLRRLFLDRSPPHFLSAAAPRRFEAGVCKQTSGGHLPSFRAAPRKPACASSRSCRHYHARSHNLTKDHCQLVCALDADGLTATTIDGVEILTINGTQT